MSRPVEVRQRQQPVRLAGLRPAAVQPPRLHNRISGSRTNVKTFGPASIQPRQSAQPVLPFIEGPLRMEDLLGTKPLGGHRVSKPATSRIGGRAPGAGHLKKAPLPPPLPAPLPADLMSLPRKSVAHISPAKSAARPEPTKTQYAHVWDRMTGPDGQDFIYRWPASPKSSASSSTGSSSSISTDGLMFCVPPPDERLPVFKAAPIKNKKRSRAHVSLLPPPPPSVPISAKPLPPFYKKVGGTWVPAPVAGPPASSFGPPPVSDGGIMWDGLSSSSASVSGSIKSNKSSGSRKSGSSRSRTSTGSDSSFHSNLTDNTYEMEVRSLSPGLGHIDVDKTWTSPREGIITQSTKLPIAPGEVLSINHKKLPEHSTLALKNRLLF